MCTQIVYQPLCPICQEERMEELIDLEGDRFYSCPGCGSVLSEDDVIQADERSADILNVQDESREYVWDDPDLDGYSPGDYSEN